MRLRRQVKRVLFLSTILGLSVSVFAQPATFVATPSPVAPGQTVSFGCNCVIPVTASNAKVTLWIYNSSGGYVGSASKTGVNFTANEPTPVTITYATSSSLAAGTYTYNLSYYNSSGGGISGAPGQTDDGSFAVGTLSGAAYSIKATPDPVAPGQTVTFNASLDPNVTASNAKATLWIYNSSGGYVGSASATGLNFTAGEYTQAAINYAVASGLAAGTYHYNLSYYNSSGGGLAPGQTNAGYFIVQSQALVKVCANAVVVGLRWTSVSSATSYTVSRNGSSLGSTALLNYADQTVAASTAYTYSVEAFDGSTLLSTQTLGVNTPAATSTGDPAYCASSAISSITWNWSGGFNQQDGSDLWSDTQGADGNTYFFFGDGGGFFGSDSNGRASFGIAEVTGTTPQITTSDASNVYGGLNTSHPSTINGKANGIIAIGSNFYAVGSIWQPGEGGPSGAPNHMEIEYSLGNPYSWVSNYSNWIFCSDQTSPTGFCAASFVNFGAGNAGAVDSYVYVLGAMEENFIGNGGGPPSAYMARVPNTQLLTQSAYQVFAGVDAWGVPKWSPTWTDMQPIFTDPGPRSLILGKISYNSVLHRFIGVGQGFVNQAAFYDAPNPWGPWTAFGYFNSNLDNTGGWGNLGTTSFGSGHGDALGINFINTWTSSDGLTMWATFSSDGNASSDASLTSLQGKDMDSYSLVSATLTLAY
jgi:hypothetical protein